MIRGMEQIGELAKSDRIYLSGNGISSHLKQARDTVTGQPDHLEPRVSPEHLVFLQDTGQI